MRLREAIYESAWRTIGDSIVDKLRRGGPIPKKDIAYRCHVSHLCTDAQLRECLARLVEEGRIRLRAIEKPDPLFPLLQVVEEVYEATERGGR